MSQHIVMGLLILLIEISTFLLIVYKYPNQKKTFFAFLVGFVLTTIIVFVILWNEKFELTKTFDSGILSSIVSIFTAAVSLITLYFLFIQIGEMQIARETTYKPLLIIESTKGTLVPNLKDYISNNNSLKHLLHILEFRPNPQNISESTEYIQISLHNVGLGVAVNIKYEWNFDENLVDNLIKKKYQSKRFDFEWKRTSIKSGETSLLNPNGIYKIVIPQEFMYLIYQFDFKDFEKIEVPFSLELSYQDISLKTHSQIFKPQVVNNWNEEVRINFTTTNK